MCAVEEEACLMYRCRIDITALPYFEVLRGNIVIRTFDVHKNLYIPPFFLPIFGPDYYVPRQ